MVNLCGLGHQPRGVADRPILNGSASVDSEFWDEMEGQAMGQAMEKETAKLEEVARQVGFRGFEMEM